MRQLKEIKHLAPVTEINQTEAILKLFGENN